MRYVVPLAVAATALAGATAFTVTATQPRELVLVARHNLPAGLRLAAADITLSAVPTGGGRDSQLLPASLASLVPGQYLSHPVIAGSPLLSGEIHPSPAHVVSTADPAGLSCAG